MYMSGADTESLVGLYLIRSTIRALAERKILTADEVREAIDAAIEECTRDGLNITRYKKAVDLMTQIRDADYGQ